MPANIDLKTNQNYDAAGVRFNLSLTSAAGAGEASFSVTVDDLASVPGMTRSLAIRLKQTI